MWHFMTIVPLLNLNGILKWPEALCCARSRVGFL